jgi:glycosyltransferase involved in cell wall biosynthesis
LELEAEVVCLVRVAAVERDGRLDMDLPCVSVVTVCFNAEKTIGQTLESVASQTYPNVEHVIVDGGSTDHTLDVVKKFERPGLVWISGPDRGMYDAMNKGIGLASGQIIGILNADDWLVGFP